MSGNMARTRPHSSDALPAPVAPAIRTWVPWSLTSQGSPSSRLPTGSAFRSGIAGVGRAADPPGERNRPEPPPAGQHDEDGQDQDDERDPAELDPGHRNQGQDASGQRMPEDQPGDPGQQPGELHGQDDAERGPVDRGPP